MFGSNLILLFIFTYFLFSFYRKQTDNKIGKWYLFQLQNTENAEHN